MRITAGGTVLARTMRLLAVAVGGALLVAMLTRGAGPARPSVPPEAPPPREVARPEETTPPEPLAALPARDIFRYAQPAPPPSSRLSAGAQTKPPAPSAAPVRLIGLVRRGGRLCAALAIAGEIDLAGAGETAGGVAVLSVDEDQGVRVRLPDGHELLLPLPQ